MKYFVEVNGAAHTVDVTADAVVVDGEPVRAHLSVEDGTPMVVLTIGEEIHRMAVARSSQPGEFTLWSDEHRFDVQAIDERTDVIRRMSAATRPAQGPAPVRAPMPGLIVRVRVQPGDRVAAGEGIVVMEAMKMENELRATTGGTVRRVLVQPGAAVEKGMILVELE